MNRFLIQLFLVLGGHGVLVLIFVTNLLSETRDIASFILITVLSTVIFIFSVPAGVKELRSAWRECREGRELLPHE